MAAFGNNRNQCIVTVQGVRSFLAKFVRILEPLLQACASLQGQGWYVCREMCICPFEDLFIYVVLDSVLICGHVRVQCAYKHLLQCLRFTSPTEGALSLFYT